MEKSKKNDEKNIALIIAGGVGARMNLDTPKQFLEINGKPLLVYTLEAFQNNKLIDEIALVCLSGWEDKVLNWAKKYNISKLKYITLGGKTGFESLTNGMELLRKNCNPNDIIVIHDAVRPLLNDDIINANIESVIQNGNAVTIVNCTEAILYSEDKKTSNKVVDRDLVYRTQTPQSVRLSKFIWCYEQAKKENIQNSVAICTLLIELGQKVNFVYGNPINFKITTKEDFELLQAYLNFKNNNNDK